MTTQRELKKQNRNKIILEAENLKEQINQLTISEQSKSRLLFSVASIILLTEAQSEAIRLADVVCFDFKNKREKEVQIKKALRKELNNILLPKEETTSSEIQMNFENLEN